MRNFIKYSDPIDQLTLLLGFFVTVKIRIVGMFSVAELILMVMFIFSKTSHFKSNKYVKNLLLFAVLWMIGTFMSNIHNNVTNIDFIKGIIFLVVMVVVIPPIYNILEDKPERLVLFFFGYGVGQVLAPFTTTEEQLAENLLVGVYIFYGFLSLALGIGYIIYFKGRKTLGLVMCYGMSVVGLFFMARNPFLTGSIAIILIYIMRNESEKTQQYGIENFKKKIPKYFVLSMLAIVIADSVYEPLAANGTFGDDAQEKYYQQKINGGNVLEGGRGETFMGIELISENPIWGYGSYAKDKGDKFHMHYAYEHKQEYFWAGEDNRLLPGHSHIVGAWVQNGIMGGVFWLYVLWMLWKVFKSGCIMNEPRLLCLVMFQFVSLIWNILFSPFGDRTFTMFFIIGLFVIYDKTLKGEYKSGQVKRLIL